MLGVRLVYSSGVCVGVAESLAGAVCANCLNRRSAGSHLLLIHPTTGQKNTALELSVAATYYILSLVVYIWHGCTPHTASEPGTPRLNASCRMASEGKPPDVTRRAERRFQLCSLGLTRLSARVYAEVLSGWRLHVGAEGRCLTLLSEDCCTYCNMHPDPRAGNMHVIYGSTRGPVSAAVNTEEVVEPVLRRLHIITEHSSSSRE